MIKICDGKYFMCDECKICDGVDFRLRLSEEYGDEPQLEYLSCDKIQYEFYIGGFCCDAFEFDTAKQQCFKRKTGRAYRRVISSKKKKQKINLAKYGHGRGYIRHDFVDGIWTEVCNHVLLPSNSRRQSFYKKHSNKKLRKYNGIVKNGSHYKRIYDYRFEVS